MLDEPVYRSEAGTFITSLCEVFPGTHEVAACNRCGHLSSAPLPDLTKYYETQYRILVANEDEDQLYRTSGGVTTYRFDHQLQTLLERVDVPNAAKVLDYGAAKGTTLKRLCERRPDIVPHLYDVSDMYQLFWDRFCPREQTAVHCVPDDWAGQFDLVLSFYALEHVADPRAFLASVRKLLRPSGIAYIIVPDVFRNACDFLVADHVNHFTRPSLEFAFQSAGFGRVEIDNASHSGAFLLLAEAAASNPSSSVTGHTAEQAVANAAELGAYWSAFAPRVRAFEAAHYPSSAAVYGSGFHGTLITTCLSRPEAVK